MDKIAPKKLSVRRLPWWGITLIAVGGLFIIAGSVVGAGWLWYQQQLAAVDTTDTEKVKVTIELASSPNAIASLLEDEGLIRSDTAFLWYTRFMGVQGQLQAGTYRLSPSESTPEIVDHLVKGNVDSFDITFLPGATLAQDRTVLMEAGYSETEVDAALNASYESPLFAGKPAGTDLEGYIYGETYRFGDTASVQDILTHVFEVFYGVIEENNLIAAYQAQGLSLYEGITLASIVQREASGNNDDQYQIAQVFYSRLNLGMVLGSDVTYQYIADKLGVPRDPNLDSPYNTRRYAGLPPGPIAAPGLQALLAVAHPAEGDYLFFLSGDDHVTYFARTLEEHEANIANHCQLKCQIL